MWLFRKNHPLFIPETPANRLVDVDVYLRTSGARMSYTFAELEAKNLINDFHAYLKAEPDSQQFSVSRDFIVNFGDVSAIVYSI